MLINQLSKTVAVEKYPQRIQTYDFIMSNLMWSLFRVVLLNWVIILLEIKVEAFHVRHSEDKLFELIGLLPVDWKKIEPERVVWAEAFHYYISQINEMYCDIFQYKLHDIPLKDQSFELTNITLDIVLDKSHYNQTLKCRDTKHESKPIGVLGPLSGEQTKYISHIFQYEEIPIITFSEVCHTLNDKITHPGVLKTVPTDRKEVEVIVALLEKFHWTFVSVVYQDTSHGKSGYEELRKRRICLSNEILIYEDLSNINTTFKSLSKGEKSKVYILFGSNKMKRAVLEEAVRVGMRKRIWILPDTFYRDPWYTEVSREIRAYLLFIFPTAGRDPEFEKYFLNLNHSTSKHNLWVRNFLQTKDQHAEVKLEKFKNEFDFSSVGFVRNAIRAYATYWLNQAHLYKERYPHNVCLKKIHNVSYIPSLKKVKFPGLNSEDIEFDENGDVKDYFYNIYITFPKRKRQRKQKNRNDENNWRNKHKNKQNRHKPYYLHERSKKKFSTETVFGADWSSKKKSFMNFDKKRFEGLRVKDLFSKCNSKPCDSGKTNISFNLKKPCCWTCIPCPENQIKLSFGNFKCHECPPDTVPNKDRTQCIRRMNLDIKYNDYVGIIILSTSTVSIVINLIILIIFILKRHTPLVRSSAFKLSLIQLICHLLFFIASFFRMGKFTNRTCIILPSVYFFLNTIIIAITITKVSRLIIIFKTKWRFTRAEITKLKRIELAFILICAIVNITIYITLHLIFKPEVSHVIIKTEELYVTFHMCNNTSTIFVANILYLLFLEIICGIQCFRGRNIPEQYNEAKYICFATFLSTLTVCMSVILRDGINSYKISILLQTLMATLGSLSVMLSLFGYKIYIIIFQPLKNSKEAFQNALWDNVGQVNKIKIHPKVERTLTASINPAYHDEERI